MRNIVFKCMNEKCNKEEDAPDLKGCTKCENNFFEVVFLKNGKGKICT